MGLVLIYEYIDFLREELGEVALQGGDFQIGCRILMFNRSGLYT